MNYRCAFLLLLEVTFFNIVNAVTNNDFSREITSINAMIERKAHQEAEETARSLLDLDLDNNDRILLTETLINIYFDSENYSAAIKYLKFLESVITEDDQKEKYLSKIADTYYIDKKYSFAAIYYKYLHEKFDKEEYLFREICAIIKSNDYDTLEKTITTNFQFNDPEIEVKTWTNIALYLFDEYKFERLFFYITPIISSGEKFYNTEHSAKLIYIYSQCLVKLGLIDRAKKILSEAIGRTKSSNTLDVERLYFALLEFALKDNELEIAYQIEQELKVRFPWSSLDFLKFYIHKYFYEEKLHEAYIILNDNLETLQHDEECMLLHLFLQMHFDLLSLEEFQERIYKFENHEISENLSIKAKYLHARILKRWNKFNDAKSIYVSILETENINRDTKFFCNLQKVKCDIALRNDKVPINFAKNNIILQEILHETKNALLQLESFYISYLLHSGENANPKTLNLLYGNRIISNLNSLENTNPSLSFWHKKIINISHDTNIQDL
jgi:hypothetical protein